MTPLLVVLLIGVAVGIAYVRLAQSDPMRWHIDPLQAEDPGMGGVLVRRTFAGDDPLERFDAAMMAEPRVTHLAGGLDEGRVTYVARTRWVGFPDYLTVARDGDALVILSRLRFGRSDLGVNAARLERVLERL